MQSFLFIYQLIYQICKQENSCKACEAGNEIHRQYLCCYLFTYFFSASSKRLINSKFIGSFQILTCDNGISAMEEIAYAKEQGLTVLVTDHHQIPFTEENGVRTEIRSMADAIVNPHQEACGYPFKDLCGAGVVYALASVLYECLGFSGEETDLLEFAAMATVCDVMPLTGVNRILVKEGIKRIRNTKNTGMKALIETAGLVPGQIDAWHFGFVLGPCINAMGRLETAEQALALFSSGDGESASQTAEELVSKNNERKEMTKQGVEEGIRLVESGGYENDPVLVLYLPDVHESIA